MVTGTRVLIGGLVAAAAGLAVALGVALATDDGDGWRHPIAGHFGPMAGQADDWAAIQERMRTYMGDDWPAMQEQMRTYMGDDWAAMQDHMRAYMSDEAYEQMLQDHAAMHSAMHPNGETWPHMPMGPGWMMPGRMP
jgi:hypothetical protein